MLLNPPCMWHNKFEICIFPWTIAKNQESAKLLQYGISFLKNNLNTILTGPCEARREGGDRPGNFILPDYIIEPQPCVEKPLYIFFLSSTETILINDKNLSFVTLNYCVSLWKLSIMKMEYFPWFYKCSIK